jgi:mono/diheme cytochrome c family protein
MTPMRSLGYAGTIVVTTLLIGIAGLVLLTTSPGTPQEGKIKTTPIPYSSPASGEQMYMDYCAVCHGKTGKGDGPLVSELKAPPPDLTRMAQRNNGKFPEARFADVLLVGTKGLGHGSVDMPIWGPAFRSVDKDLTKLRIANLGRYVESLQVK